MPGCTRPCFIHSRSQEQLDYCELHLGYVFASYHALHHILLSPPARPSEEDMQLHARDAEACLFSECQIIAAYSVAMRTERWSTRNPVCLVASHQRVWSVVVPSQRTRRSTMGVSAARSIGTPIILTLRVTSSP